MGLFAFAICGHLVGDFLLQTNWMAVNKGKKPAALLLHSAVYTAAVSLAAWMSDGLRWYAVLIVFVSHVCLDQRTFVLWWCRTVTKSAEIPWLVLAADQSWHVLILAAACMLSA